LPVRALRVVAFALVMTALLHCHASAGPGGNPVSYARQIRPVLQTKCQGCHQPASAGGKLILATYADFMKGGEHGATVVAGRPEAGTLLGYLTGKPELMPQGGPALPPAQIDLFRRWIAEGARDDTPAAADPIDAQHPPVYSVPPVITALAYAPDGKTLAVSGYREILLHRADGSGLIARLVGRSQKILSLIYSPDGKTLAAVGGSPAEFGEAQFWDTTTAKPINSVMIGYDTLFGGSYSPDGKELGFGCADNSVRVISAPDGKPIMRLDNHSDWVFATTFSTDGKDILSVSRDQAIKLTQVDTGSFIDDINTHYTALRCLVRRPGADQVMCAGDDGIPRLYKIFRTEARTMNQEDHNLLRAYDPQGAVATCLAFSADGKKFAVGTETGQLALYGVDDGKLIGKLTGATGGLYALAFRPDGAQLAAGGFDGVVRLYDLSTGRLAKAFVPVPLVQKRM
jgi:mono/diheme cytochrome c family protein